MRSRVVSTRIVSGWMLPVDAFKQVHVAPQMTATATFLVRQTVVEPIVSRSRDIRVFRISGQERLPHDMHPPTIGLPILARPEIVVTINTEDERPLFCHSIEHLTESIK